MTCFRNLLPSILPLALAVLAGCKASGPPYADVADKIPALDAGRGRVFFYRSGSIFGSAVQPTIYLDGEAVGSSVPSGFFFVDRRPGSCEVSCETETENKLTFTLASQETRYVRTTVSVGVFVGHVTPELVDPAEGLAGVQGCRYIGKPLPGMEDPSPKQIP